MTEYLKYKGFDHNFVDFFYIKSSSLPVHHQEGRTVEYGVRGRAGEGGKP